MDNGALLFLDGGRFIWSKEPGAAGFVGTQTCIDCHSTWQDNNPPTQDIISGNVSPDYVPLDLRSTHAQQPFYTIPEAYVSSIHNLTTFDINPDHVKCEGCHGSGLAHFGVGSIPTPIPDIKTCGQCQNLSPSAGFPLDLQAFLSTAHANHDNKPGKFFDQRSNGTRGARTTSLTPSPPQSTIPPGLTLFKSNQTDTVSKNERIEDCSVCHNYALNYPQFIKKIAQENMSKKPTVSCGACHDSHIVGPNGKQPGIVSSTVKVTGITGSNVTAVTPVEGRKIFFINVIPFSFDTFCFDSSAQIYTGGVSYEGIYKGLGARVNGSYAKTMGERTPNAMLTRS